MSRAGSDYRRACCAGEHLVVPGYVGSTNGPVDIVRMGGDELSSWSHVKRHTISDLWHCHGHPCVVGGSAHPGVQAHRQGSHLKMRVGS